jgi:hypothetical protein
MYVPASYRLIQTRLRALADSKWIQSLDDEEVRDALDVIDQVEQNKTIQTTYQNKSGR